MEDVSPFTRDLIEVYNEDSNESYFLEVDVQYPKKLHDLRNDLPFFSGKNENYWKNWKTCTKRIW